MLRYFTAGETHGKCLTAIIEGMPAGIRIDIERINLALARRQKGYGRGGRMKIETDRAEILSGVRGGYTLGSPIALKIENRDFANWESIMGSETATSEKSVECPRPGHADLPGGMKYNHKDLRNVLERASARETAARVAVGAIAAQVLEGFGVTFSSRVVRIGSVEDASKILDADFYQRVAQSEVGFGDASSEEKAIAYINMIKEAGETCGGVVETVVSGLPIGLGSYAQYDRKLDARLAGAVMSIQAIKGVEIGIGFEAAILPGSQVHDEISYQEGKFTHLTNHAGGIEGGITNGEPVVVRAAMKPIPTLYTPLRTVSLADKSEQKASVERSDVCAVPACSVVVEAVVAFEIANAFLEKFSGDCAEDITASYRQYAERLSQY